MSDGPRIPVPPLDSGDEATQAVFARFQAERGNVPNMFRTMSLRPEIMQTANAHLAAVLNTGTVSKALKELCIVRVSSLNGCAY